MRLCNVVASFIHEAKPDGEQNFLLAIRSQLAIGFLRYDIFGLRAGISYQAKRHWIDDVTDVILSHGQCSSVIVGYELSEFGNKSGQLIDQYLELDFVAYDPSKPPGWCD